MLLAPLEEFTDLALGVVREFVDFVDASQDANVSRAPLLPSWGLLVGSVERVRLAVKGRAAPTVERVVEWMESQVSAMLAVYRRLGHSVDGLVLVGESRFRHRHRSLLHFAGVSP